MTKTEMIGFITDQYCDIEKFPIPKIIGELPPKERLVKRSRMKKIIELAGKTYGETFAYFIEYSFCKTSVRKKKNTSWFFQIDFDDWDFMYSCWQDVESGNIPQ